MGEFIFEPIEFVPFRDKKVLKKASPSRERIELYSLQTMGTFVSWQRMISRLILLGPVTPYIPGSIFQTPDTQVSVSEEIAALFVCWETVGY